MKDLKVITEGVKGGSGKSIKVGYTGLFSGGEKLISIDNFQGHGDDYKQREEPIICVFGKDSYDVIFEGTHQQLIQLLKK